MKTRQKRNKKVETMTLKEDIIETIKIVTYMTTVTTLFIIIAIGGIETFHYIITKARIRDLKRQGINCLEGSIQWHCKEIGYEKSNGTRTENGKLILECYEYDKGKLYQEDIELECTPNKTIENWIIPDIENAPGKMIIKQR